MANSIKVSFQLEGNEALRTLDRLTKASEKFTDKTTTGMKKTAKETKATSNAMSSFVGNLAAIGASKALYLLTSQITESTRAALKFEKSIAEINTLLPANAKLTKASKDQFLELSKAYGKDVTSQTKAFYDIVSAGVKGTSNQMDVLTAANEAAIAGITDVNVAADVLTSSLNSFAAQGLTATQASDALFTAVREGKTTFGELASSIGQVAPISAAVGITFSEMTGTLAAITKNGVSTAEAVTGLKAVMTAVVKPSEEAKKAAKEMGLDFSTAGLRAKGMAQFLKELTVATKGNESEIAKLVPNVRALSPILGIVRGDFDSFKKTLDATKNSMGATADASAIMKKTMGFKLDQANQSIKAIGLSLANSLIPQVLLVTKYWANWLAVRDGDSKGNKAASDAELVAQKIKILKESIAKLSAEKLSIGNDEEWLKPEIAIGKIDEKLKDFKSQLKDLSNSSDGFAIASLKASELNKEIADSEAMLSRMAQDKTYAKAMGGNEQALALIESIGKQKAELQSLEETKKRIAADQDARRADKLAKDKAAAAAKNAIGIAAAQADFDTAAASILAEEEQETNRQAFLTELRTVADDQEKAQKEIKTAFLNNLDDERLQFLQENLGKETAIKELARIKDIKDEKKRKEELQKLNLKAVAQSKASLIDLRKFEDMTNVQKVEAQKSTLNTIATLSQSNNGILFAIGKAASLSLAGINVAEGVTKALAAYPPPFNLAAASAVGAAGAIQIAKIASSSPPKFAEGGILQGSAVNDRNTASFNGGEMFLKQRQQATLFNAIDTGSVGSGGTTVNLNSPIFLNEEMVDDVIDRINDRVELGNKRLVSSEVA